MNKILELLNEKNQTKSNNVCDDEHKADNHEIFDDILQLNIPFK